MSTQTQERVNVVIDGKSIQASPSLSVIQALWNAGYPRVKGVGCLEGVCGSCRVMVRRAGEDKVRMELACQTLVEEGYLLKLGNRRLEIDPSKIGIGGNEESVEFPKRSSDWE